MASDTLRNTYGYSPTVVKDLIDSVRNMYATVPGASIDDFTVRLDPLVPGGVPVQLVPVRSDDFGGEWILDTPADCSVGATLRGCTASPHAPAPSNMPLSAPTSKLMHRVGSSSPLRAHAKVIDAFTSSRSGGTLWQRLEIRR